MFGNVCVPRQRALNLTFNTSTLAVYRDHSPLLPTTTMDTPVAARRRTAGASSHSGSSQVSEEPEERYVSTYSQVRCFAPPRAASRFRMPTHALPVILARLVSSYSRVAQDKSSRRRCIDCSRILYSLLQNQQPRPSRVCIAIFCAVESPAYVFERFDEVHFGKFAAFYILGEYYFDVHPPLAKLMLGAAGWFSGFDGNFNFENIGDSYSEHHVPYVGIRALPATLGSLTVPIIYAIMKESGYSTIIAAFSAVLVLFGKSVKV